MNADQSGRVLTPGMCDCALSVPAHPRTALCPRELGRVQSLVERLLDMANDPDHLNKLAAHEAARTDPWRWYCRLCGATGENPDRMVRNDEAYAHVGADGPHAKPTVADAESGRLLHVWCY